MKDNKGFTLIELLAMLVVIGILIAVAIPNIAGILENQRINIYKDDATNMLETAKIKAAKLEEAQKPGNNECIVYTLNYLNDNGNIEKGPNGGAYYKYDSFVIYVRKGQEYKYYVRLVEKNGSKNTGLVLTEQKSLASFDKSKINDNMTLYETSDNVIDSKLKIEGGAAGTGICTAGVKEYYPGV